MEKDICLNQRPEDDLSVIEACRLRLDQFKPNSVRNVADRVEVKSSIKIEYSQSLTAIQGS